jgi:ribonuclease HII
MKPDERYELRELIRKKALAWAVASVDHDEIDRINILRASFKAMHLALEQLPILPELILVDGHLFAPYATIPHKCMIKGDAEFASIAAASVRNPGTSQGDRAVWAHALSPTFIPDQGSSN